MIVASFCFQFATVDRYDNGRIVVHYFGETSVNITTAQFYELMRTTKQA